MTTSTATTSTSYSTTVYIPATAQTIHPTNDSQPRMDPPEAARAHDENAAATFSEWYVRWLLYAYIAGTTDPLAQNSENCVQCSGAINIINRNLKDGVVYVGNLAATIAVDTHRHEGSVDVTVKYSNDGYQLKSAGGAVLYEYPGGEGYYVLTVSWNGQKWMTNQIVTVRG